MFRERISKTCQFNIGDEEESNSETRCVLSDIKFDYDKLYNNIKNKIMISTNDLVDLYLTKTKLNKNNYIEEYMKIELTTRIKVTVVDSLPIYMFFGNSSAFLSGYLYYF